MRTRFGVSRPVIRDALARLKDEGYVRSQRGSGSVVVRGEAPGVQAYPPIRTVSDLLRSYEFRITVESATAAMAAERREASRPRGPRRARSIAPTDAIDTACYHLLADLNFDFHRAVARATHNPFYLKTVEMIPNFIGAERLDLHGVRRRGHAPNARGASTTSTWRSSRRSVAASPSRRCAQWKAHIAAARDFVLERQEFAPPIAQRARATTSLQVTNRSTSPSGRCRRLSIEEEDT